MQRLHHYPDIKAMFRRLLIATVIGVLASLAVALFRHAMYLGEWLFLSNDSGSLVNAAGGLVWWRRLITPALGGLAAGTLLCLATSYATTSPCADGLYGGAGKR